MLWISTDMPDMPTDMPADMPDMPADMPDMPPDMPADMPDMPADMPDMPADMPDMPADMPDMPADMPDMPADMPVMPTDMPDMPADMPANMPAYMPDMPTDMPTDMADMPDMPADMKGRYIGFNRYTGPQKRAISSPSRSLPVLSLALSAALPFALPLSHALGTLALWFLFSLLAGTLTLAVLFSRTLDTLALWFSSSRVIGALTLVIFSHALGTLPRWCSHFDCFLLSGAHNLMASRLFACAFDLGNFLAGAFFSQPPLLILSLCIFFALLVTVLYLALGLCLLVADCPVALLPAAFIGRLPCSLLRYWPTADCLAPCRLSGYLLACNGLCILYPSRVEFVPRIEAPSLLSIQKKACAISKGTWVRMKNGKYKGDLAEVVLVNDAKKRVTIKLVPRIDLQAISKKFHDLLREELSNQKQKGRGKPYGQLQEQQLRNLAVRRSGKTGKRRRAEAAGSNPQRLGNPQRQRNLQRLEERTAGRRRVPPGRQRRAIKAEGGGRGEVEATEREGEVRKEKTAEQQREEGTRPRG
ncbi:hypothetical protein KSP39_PZI021942 [Platanthera zijinensis]|uniref:Spt5 KOW domain-containing protein n=1 Tax=Platanthera zijinensis TaxID=2320716 RepID=A0AAP0AXY9_9ASPA